MQRSQQLLTFAIFSLLLSFCYLSQRQTSTPKEELQLFGRKTPAPAPVVRQAVRANIILDLSKMETKQSKSVRELALLFNPKDVPLSKTYSISETVNIQTLLTLTVGNVTNAANGFKIRGDFKGSSDQGLKLSILEQLSSYSEFGKTATRSQTIDNQFTLYAQKGEKVQADLVTTNEMITIPFSGKIIYDNNYEESVQGVYQNYGIKEFNIEVKRI